MKKAFWLIMIGILLISFLTACGTSTPSVTKSPGPTQSISPSSTVPSTTTSASPTITQTVTTPTQTGKTPKYGGVLRVVNDAVPATSIGFPPEIQTGSGESIQLVLEPLLRSDSQGHLSPWLAEAYEIAPDFKSVTFKIRKGVKFHDGSDLNAQVVKWNLDNQIEAKLVPNWSSVEVIDDYTVRVNIVQWMNIVMDGFADGSSTWMISKAAFDKNGIDWVRQNPVGTGPFKFLSFSRDTAFKAVKNPDYWQPGKPYVDKIEIIYVIDKVTQSAVMQSEGADMIAIEFGKRTKEMADIGLEVVANSVTTSSLIPDTANPDSPWYNLKVREAAEYAIDREAIAKAFGFGYWKAAYQVPARAYPVYDPNFVGRRYDPEKAKQLLAEAGYPNGFKTTIICNPLGLNKDVVVAVQSYLAKVGIDAALEFPEFSKYQPSYLMGTWKNACLYQVWPGTANYNSIIYLYLRPNGPFLKSWLRTPEFISLFEKSMTSPKPDINLIRAVFNQIHKEAGYIPINEAGKSWAMRSYVKDGGWYERSISSWWKPEQIWLDK